MTIKKYAVPAGVTSITLPDGSVLIPVGNVVSTDCRYESDLVRSGCVSDDSLYLLGIPRTTFQTAVPFVMPPGDGGSNGLTFTGGGGGAFTLSAAPLAGLFSGLSGSGSYVYLPANAGGSGNAAGWYYCVFSSDTEGTIYGDQYTGGQPQIVGSPGAFGGAPSGRITTPTSEITALSGINLLTVGANGSIMLFPRFNGDSSSTKTYRIKAGGSLIASESDSTGQDCERGIVVRNRGVTGKQTGSHQNAGIGQVESSLSGDFLNVNLSGTPALTATMQMSANTGCAVLLGLIVDQRYGA
jgi:hypothetical protein